MKRILIALVATVAAVLGVAGPARATATGVAPATGGGYYLALGDSLAAGYQPGLGNDPTGGYVGGVYAALRLRTPRTTLVNLGCSGETTTSMTAGGVCSYAEGSQLAAALAFLRVHGRQTRTVTLDIGSNDVQRCVSRTGGGIDLACVQSGLADVATNLPVVLAQVRAAAPGARIVVLNYYNPFLAAWLTGPAGQVLAQQSNPLDAQLNAIIAAAAAPSRSRVADVAGAFRTTSWTVVPWPGLGAVPVNVGVICTLTWMCSKTDIHPNDLGYAVMAWTVVARL